RGVVVAVVGDFVRGHGAARVFFSDVAVTRAGGILSLHDALPICPGVARVVPHVGVGGAAAVKAAQALPLGPGAGAGGGVGVAVGGEDVTAHRPARGGLAGRVVHRASGVLVVAGAVGERPGVARVV